MSISLSQFDTIITANVRQAFHLRDLILKDYSDIAIMSIGQYLQSLVAQGVTAISQSNGVVSDFEDREIWEQVIKLWQKREGKELVNTSATARLAKQAFELIVKYQLPTPNDEHYESSESRVLREWANQYQSIIANKGLITHALKDAYLMQEICDGNLPLPSNMAFFGFYMPNQIEKQLLVSASDLGIPHFTHEEMKASVQCLVYPEVQDEIAACAMWVKQKVDKNPSTKIGIIAPEITKNKGLIQRVFDNVLLPNSLFQPVNNHERPYRISVGEPLSNYAAVKTFFDIFKLRLNGKILFDDISMFLRNPLVGGAKFEAISRAKLELQLRKLGSKKVSWNTLKQIANTQVHGDVETNYFCPDLVDRMTAHEAWLSKYGSGRFGYHELSSVFTQTAYIWGLEELAGNKVHGEVIDTFLGNAVGEGVIPTLAKLNDSLPPISLMGAITKLKSLTLEVRFQPASGSNRIQIMSESDALGMKFDAVWVMGLTANNWPSKTQPNPLIMQDIQFAHHVPHANAEQELIYAKFVTEIIVTSSPEVVLSCYGSEKGECVRPSSIIATYGKIKAFGSIEMPDVFVAKGMANKSELTAFVDNKAPSLKLGKTVAGGTGLLKSQAQCPFKGFVENRLGIRKLDEPEVGLSASLRGEVLHLVFEKFWKEVKSQDALKKLELSASLYDEVSAAVSKALRHYIYKKPEIFTTRIVEIESKRLILLVVNWMREIELNRAPFEHVEVETVHNIVLNGMELKIKMDHRDIDCASGAINIADNKTGAVTTDDWFDSRLMEPQVPLYALVEFDAGNKINSVAFKRIKRDEFAIKGVVSEEGIYPKVKAFGAEKMTEALDTWRKKIDDIAVEYQSGVANICPTKVTKSCAYCPLKPACRYHLAA